MGLLSNPRAFDRLIGIMATITGGLVIMMAQSWVRSIIAAERKKSKKAKQDIEGDAFHQSRYKENNPLYDKSNTVLHNGMCHCQRVRFRIRAPTVLKAVDVPSKIRFPRVTIPCEFFEALTPPDDGIMSLYAIKCGEIDPAIGVYTFCSFCGGKRLNLQTENFFDKDFLFT